MHRRIVCSCLAFALAAAMTPAAMAQGGDTGGSLSVPEQIGGTTGGDAESVQQIAPADGGGIDVEQPTGRDLCDPSVPDSARRAAGVDCEREIPADAGRARPALADDPLLTPRDETLKDDFQGLDLGDDVPATVILQQ
jgi:hypothetical protein